MHLKIAPQLERFAPQVLKWGAVLHLRKKFENSRTEYIPSTNDCNDTDSTLSRLRSESPCAHLSPCVLSRYNTKLYIGCTGIPNLFPLSKQYHGLSSIMWVKYLPWDPWKISCNLYLTLWHHSHNTITQVRQIKTSYLIAFHAAGERRRQFKNITDFVNNIKIVEFHDHI